MCRLGKMVPAETEVLLDIKIVNAAAGITVKLSVKKMDLAWLDSAALLCQRLSQKLRRDPILDRFPLRPFPCSYIPHEFSACEKVRIVPI